MSKRAIALGTFDGVHMGHRRIIDGLLKLSRERGLKPLIYTFSNHPMELFNGAPCRIMEDAERISLLGESAPVLAEKFDGDLAATEPEAFVRRLVEEQGMAAAVAGFNYTFGRRGAGNMDTMRALGGKYGFETLEVPAYMYKGEPVSSTRIRRCVEAGEISDANAMLGREFSIKGRIVANRGIGSGIGYPTANIPVPEGLVLPKAGVYAGRAEIGGRIYGAVTNIGPNPTVHGENTTVETHIIGFEGSVYGETLSIRLSERLRDEIAFASLAELAAQICRDKEKAAELLGI